jgi:hypothetical protein
VRGSYVYPIQVAAGYNDIKLEPSINKFLLLLHCGDSQFITTAKPQSRCTQHRLIFQPFHSMLRNCAAQRIFRHGLFLAACEDGPLYRASVAGQHTPHWLSMYPIRYCSIVLRMSFNEISSVASLEIKTVFICVVGHQLCWTRFTANQTSKESKLDSQSSNITRCWPHVPEPLVLYLRTGHVQLNSIDGNESTTCITGNVMLRNHSLYIDGPEKMREDLWIFPISKYSGIFVPYRSCRLILHLTSQLVWIQA